MSKIVLASLVGGAAAGGKLAITWEDCGDSSTHGRITDLQPSELTIGEDGTMTGTGTIDEALTDGSFEIEVSASLGIHKTYIGKACEAKTFNLPLNLGTVSWGGLDCPVAAGTITQAVGFTTKASIPAALAKADVKATAVDQNGNKAVCVNAHLQREELEVQETCSLYEIGDGSCGQSDLNCKYVKYAKLAEKGLQDGTCASKGYTLQTGTETKHYPVIGDIVITQYDKPSLSATGGKLAITWEDCGDSSTHGRITDLQPAELVIGQDGTMTGTGTIDEALTDGSFEIEVSASLGIHKTYTGKACEAKTFNLPLNLGTVSWGGLDCPVAAGTITQTVGFTTKASIPAALAKADVKATAVDQNGNKAVCVTAHLQREELKLQETCSLYEIGDGSCGQSDLNCKYVKYAKSAEKGLQDGTCASRGYTVQTGTKTKHYPVIGDIVIAQYDKPSLSTTGGKLAITWEDCGDSSTHGRITDLQPAELVIGQDGTMTGTGTIDEALTDGSFAIEVSASLGIHKTYTGKACEAKTFNLPLNLGTVSWGGLDCPVAAGTITQSVGFTTKASIPAALAKADVKATAVDQNGNKAVCVTAHLQREALKLQETCSLYEIGDGSCGQSDLNCKYVKYAKSAEKALQDGTCASKGYTLQTGTQTKHYPVIGDIVITQYNKPSLSVVV